MKWVFRDFFLLIKAVITDNNGMLINGKKISKGKIKVSGRLFGKEFVHKFTVHGG